MQANIEEKLGFDIIRNMILEKCHGQPGRILVEQIAFSSDFDQIRNKLLLASDFRNMLLSVPGFMLDDYEDLREELARCRIEGTFLDTDVILGLRRTLTNINRCIHFIRSLKPETYHHLFPLVACTIPEEALLSSINKVFDDRGNMFDNASPALLKIRREIISRTAMIDKKIAQLLTHAKTQKLVNTDVEIAVRNGRLVIPVPAANKRKLKGVIHDESATGSTVYIEPTEVFELNNHIRELELAEHREIIKILVALTDLIRPKLPRLLELYSFIAEVDRLNAIAGFSIDIGATLPLISPSSTLDWLQARHPLLYLSHRKQGREVVPLEIKLTDIDRILIISGPNAGGKSVCLKTVGLLQYMLQCGLPVPMSETSEAGVFKDIFIDIGDQQSIENDLSTYSSHLTNIKRLIQTGGPGSLFLIDEFGSGTEPESGGAIAESVLEELNAKKASGVVTTHYANLKLLARQGNGFVNGAMMFDTKRMKPLFKLKIGNPGSSFAFEIARSIEFPAKVLDQAAEKLGHEKLDFDRQLQELETEKMDLQRREKQLRMADELLSETMAKYAELTRDLETRKKEIMETARLEARRLVEQVNKQIEKTIREIRESQAEKAVTQKARSELKEMAARAEKVISDDEQTVSEIQEPFLPEPETAETPLLPGDKVIKEGHTEIGEITELSAYEALVAFRTVSLKIPLSELRKISVKGQAARLRPADTRQSNMINDMNARLANFRITIDLRGYRAEEALNTLQRYVDEAIMLHVTEVHILHGKGNGILRQAIRNMLANTPGVRNFSDAPLESGGSGITIVQFK